jgi:VIT1/CCC1 family predicted Fe2+/Mn2+ transporter
MRKRHAERHHSERIGWLRAAVLGANDGILSTASLVVGVAAAGTPRSHVIVAGIAGLVAGAMSMAAGEYVSVSSQSDTQEADLALERQELSTDVEAERDELTSIYVDRGLERDLARQVADQLMAYDALGAHARDELSISELQRARPVQAAVASAATFAVGAGVPLAVMLVTPANIVAPAVTAASLVVLAGLGWLAARAGGARGAIGAVRVAVWGALAMTITYGVGALFAAVV